MFMQKQNVVVKPNCCTWETKYDHLAASNEFYFQTSFVFAYLFSVFYTENHLYCS